MVFHDKSGKAGGLKLMEDPGQPPIPGVCPPYFDCVQHPDTLYIHIQGQFIVIEGTADNPFLTCFIDGSVNTVPDGVILTTKVQTPPVVDCASQSSQPSTNACEWCFDVAQPQLCDGSNSGAAGLYQSSIECKDGNWQVIFSERDFFGSPNIRWLAVWAKPIDPDPDEDHDPQGIYDFVGGAIQDVAVHQITGPRLVYVNTDPDPSPGVGPYFSIINKSPPP